MIPRWFNCADPDRLTKCEAVALSEREDGSATDDEGTAEWWREAQARELYRATVGAAIDELTRREITRQYPQLALQYQRVPRHIVKRTQDDRATVVAHCWLYNRMRRAIEHGARAAMLETITGRTALRRGVGG